MKRRRVLLLLLAVAGLTILAHLGLWAFTTYGYQSYKIPTISMEPTMLPGDHIYVDKRTFRSREPRRGELVVYLMPGQEKRIEKVARVVAVPGDRVEIQDKKLLLNGQLQDEPYAVHRDPGIMPAFGMPRDDFGPFVVPPGHYFTLGDNRDYSHDGRFYGPVERSRITGGPGMWVYWSYDPQSRKARWDRVGKSLR